MRKLQYVLALVLVFCLTLTSCKSQEARKPKVETTMVRLYEVIPVPEHLGAHGQYQYQYPVVRAGLEYGISMSTEDKASFLTAIAALQHRSGMEIEHVILGSWDELRQELQEARGDGVTKLVLFDNSYDQSLIKEAMNGGYIDFAPMLEETGIYDSEEYQQAVLQAGQIGTQQMLVPILYNVAGMTAEDKEYAEEPPTYDQMLDWIKAAGDSKTEMSQMSYVSKAMLDEVDVDLFWNAAGQPWDGYKRQQEFFNVLYEYVMNYDYDEIVLKKTWTIYIDQLDDDMQNGDPYKSITEDTLTDEEMLAVGLDPNELASKYLWQSLYRNTAYYIECTGAESDPYHSVVGTIDSICNYYDGEYMTKTPIGNEGAYTLSDFRSYFAYWPIQMFNDEGYAAQPFCYVAALNDGDEEAAFKVIQEIMKQSFSLQFGFSVYEPAWREKFEKWNNVGGYELNRFSRACYQQGDIWKEEQGGRLFGGIDVVDEDRNQLIDQLLSNQLDNIQYAQIADAEVMSIWQDTLNECVNSNLTAEAGYELLCERMDMFCDSIG